jgi:hypothetical protein
MHVEPKDIITLLLAEVQKAGSVTAWAINASIHRAVVSAALHHKRSIPKKLIRALGLRSALSLTDESRLLEARDIWRLVRTEVAEAGSQSAWARKTGIPRPDINKVVQGKKQPNKKIIEALGLRVVFVSAKDAK